MHAAPIPEPFPDQNCQTMLENIDAEKLKRMPFLGLDTRKLADRKIACERLPLSDPKRSSISQPGKRIRGKHLERKDSKEGSAESAPPPQRVPQPARMRARPYQPVSRCE